MAQHVYEGMFLFDSNRYARNPQGVSGKIGEMIEKHGGEMLASRLWSDQKLAYPINGQRKGTYWLTYFRLDSLKLVDVDRDCRLNDDLLRNLILKIDPRLVDTLVEHAKQGTTLNRPVEGEVIPEIDEDEIPDLDEVESNGSEAVVVGEIDAELKSE